MHARHGRPQAKGAGHVVAVADKGQGHPRQPPQLLLHRQQVGQGLTGVLAVGQGVDDGHGGPAGQLLHRLVGEGTGGDAVHVSAHHPCHVLHRLSRSQAHLLGRQVQTMATQMLHGHIKGNASPQGRFLEQQGQGLAGQKGIAACLPAGRVTALQAQRRLDDPLHLLGRQVGYGNEVAALQSSPPNRQSQYSICAATFNLPKS